jgi:hypothetical protein
MESDSGTSFARGHIKLIVLSVVALTAALFMRGGFTLGAFNFGHAKADKPGMTYEQALAQARQILAQQGGAQGSADSSQTQSQLAELDPTMSAPGQVLGASTGLDTSVDPDEVLNSDVVTSLPLNIYQTNDRYDWNDYALQLHQIESEYGTNFAIGALSGRDPQSLESSAQTYKAVVAELRNLKVPSQFENYHRMKIVYYTSLAQMALSMSPNGPDDNAISAASLFYSLGDKIKTARVQLSAQYGVVL